jgi:hypothetical protein
MGAAADFQPEPDRVAVAPVAARPAGDAAAGQAGFSESRRQGPGIPFLFSEQSRTFGAGPIAGPAEIAGAARKIDLRKSAVADGENVLRTGRHTITARRAAVGEQRIGNRPRRPDFSGSAPESTEKHIPSARRSCHAPRFSFYSPGLPTAGGPYYRELTATKLTFVKNAPSRQIFLRKFLRKIRIAQKK